MTHRNQADVPPPLDPDVDLGPAGPSKLLIIGPPGTGKTDAIRREIVPRLMRAGAVVNDILICTFTKSAAGEIRRRLAKDLHQRDDGLSRLCSTIHSEAWRLVRASCVGDLPTVIGGEPVMALEPDQGSMSVDRAAVRAWDLARHTFVSLAQVAPSVAPEYSLKELHAIVDEYEIDKRKGNRIDYTDMLLLALDLDPPERAALIIDECQDLTPLMTILVDRWAARSRRVVQVGDPDQVIHEWAGVEASRLLLLARDGYQVRRLAVSRRVPRTAHALARDLIRQTANRIDAPYLPADREGEVRDVDLVEAVAEVDRVAAEGRSVLVLARTARLLGPFAVALAEAGVPYEHERGSSPRTGPAAAVARAVLDLRGGLRARAVDVARLALRLPALPGLRPEDVAETIRTLRPTETRVDVQDLLEAGAQVSTIMDPASNLVALRAVLGHEEGAHVLAIVERCGFEGLTLATRVTLTTTHGAKGREADLAVLDLTMPARVRRGLGDGVDVVEAERRVLYVGLTRTRDQLLLVRAARHDLGEELGLAPVARAHTRDM